jgi:hypothetical protein
VSALSPLDSSVDLDMAAPGLGSKVEGILRRSHALDGAKGTRDTSIGGEAASEECKRRSSVAAE